MKYLVQIIFIFQFIFLNNLQVYSQSWVLDSLYVEEDYSSGWFSLFVDMNKNSIIAGSPNQSYQNDSIDRKKGVAYLIRLDPTIGITKTETIIPQKWDEGEEFGRAVAISNNVLVVGAPSESYRNNQNELVPGTGCAYIYEKDQNDEWKESQKVFGTPANISARAGWGVSCTDSAVYVGAFSTTELKNPKEPYYEKWVGGVFEFRKIGNNWVQTGLISAPESLGAGTGLGIKSQVDQDFLILSHPSDSWDDQGKDSIRSSGAVYSYYRKDNKWEFVEKVTSYERTEGSLFGEALSLGEGWVAIGAPYGQTKVGNEQIRNAGAVYLYQISSDHRLIFKQKLTAPAHKTNHLFGSAVCIDSNRMLIGSGSGAYVYLLVSGKWEYLAQLNPPNFQDDDGFGTKVLSRASYVLVSAPTREHMVNNVVQKRGVLMLYRYGWPLNVNYYQESSGFSVYPNPTSSDANIVGNADAGIKRVIVLSPIGKTVSDKRYDQITYPKLNFDGAHGLYTVIIQDNQEQQHVMKVVKLP